jgi:hypothetical protein
MAEVKKAKSSTAKQSTKVEEAADEQKTPIRDPLQKRLLLEWEADDRPYKRLNKEVFSTIVAGAGLLGVILFIIDGVVPVVMLIAFLFLWYVLGTVKPRKVKHYLTTWGIETEDKVYFWEYMTRYWVEGSEGHRMLVIELALNWPRNLRLMLDSRVTEDVLREALDEVIIEDRPAANWLEKASRWLEGKIRWEAAG